MLRRPQSPSHGILATALAFSLIVLGAGSASASALAEGAFDPTFAANRHFTPVGSAGDEGHALALQPDGKVVVAGFATDSSPDTALVRYTAGGVLDTGFDGDGKQIVPVGPLEDEANGVAIAPDGRIVVAGYVSGATFVDTTVLRFNPNGSLDSTFDGDGIVQTDASPLIDDQANAVAVQADGKVVVAGSVGTGNDTDFEILRYRTDGTLDPAFDDDGIVILDIGDSTDRANAVTIQPDGKIVVAGSSFNLAVSNDDAAVARFRPNGSLDPSFGDAGVKRVGNLSLDQGVSGVAVGEGGDIVTVGFGYYFDQTDFPGALLQVIRYSPNGSSATVKFPYPLYPDFVGTGVAFQPDGKMVISTKGDPVSVFESPLPVGSAVRLAPDGRPDSTFVAEDSDGNAPMDASGVAIRPTGKIVVAGTAGSGSFADLAVARFIGDSTPPSGARVLGVPRYSLATTRTVSWTASDAGTGVAAFDVQRRQASFDGSAFTPFSAFRTKTLNVFGTFTGSPGHTYCLRARGRDFSGNVGAYGTQSCEAIPLDERAMTATGSWTDLSSSAYYRGTAMSSTATGSKLSVHGTYRHLAVVVTTCSNCGTLKVLLGTTLIGTVDLGSTATKHQRVIQVSAPPTPRSGTITLKQSSTGKRVVIEGLAVSRA